MTVTETKLTVHMKSIISNKPVDDTRTINMVGRIATFFLLI
jgi:hypothetical protein